MKSLIVSRWRCCEASPMPSTWTWPSNRMSLSGVRSVITQPTGASRLRAGRFVSRQRRVATSAMGRTEQVQSMPAFAENAQCSQVAVDRRFGPSAAWARSDAKRRTSLLALRCRSDLHVIRVGSREPVCFDAQRNIPRRAEFDAEEGITHVSHSEFCHEARRPQASR